MIRKIIFITAVCILECICCFSQHTFIRKYDDESVVSFLIRQHADGSYRLFSRYNATGTDLNSTITSINEYGDIINLLKFGVPRNEYVEDVFLDGDQYVMTGGHTRPDNYYEPFLFKLNTPDTTGSMYKFFSISTQTAGFMKILPIDQYYYFIGTKYVNPSKQSDVCIMKTDTNGNVIWEKTYGYDRGDWANSAIITNDGGILAIGARFRQTPGWQKIYAVKIDSAGNEQWSRTIGNPHDTLDICTMEAYDVVQAANNNYYIVGYNDTWCYDRLGRGQNASVLLCLDSAGDQLWMRQEHFEILSIENNGVDTIFQHQAFFDIVLSSDGEIVCAGDVYQNINNSTDKQDAQVMLVKFDLNGNIRWKRYYGDEGYNDYTYDLIRTADNGYAICGRRDKVDNQLSVKSYIIKTNECGCISGCDATCETVVGIEKEQVRKNIIKLYPNPATDRLSIESIEHFTLIEVKDILGRALITLNHPQQNQIDVSALTKGIYFLSAYTKEREVYNATFVKE